MSEYFQKPKSLGTNVNVELDKSSYAAKQIQKTSDFTKNTDLANLKSDVNKLDIDKLKNVSSSLSNLKSKVDKLDVR